MTATSTCNISLTEAEWQAVLNHLAAGPWRAVNPLMMRIAEQLQAQQQGQQPPNPQPANPLPGRPFGNSGAKPSGLGNEEETHS